MYCLPSERTQKECIIVIEAGLDAKSLNVIAQTSRGQEALRLNVLEKTGNQDLSSARSALSRAFTDSIRQ